MTDHASSLDRLRAQKKMAGAVFGEVVMPVVLAPRIANDISYVTDITSHPVALRIVNDVLYVMRINDASHFR